MIDWQSTNVDLNSRNSPCVHLALGLPRLVVPGVGRWSYALRGNLSGSVTHSLLAPVLGIKDRKGWTLWCIYTSVCIHCKVK